MAGFWGFWAGISLSIAMLVFWAPYKVNKEEKLALSQSWQNQVAKLNEQIEDMSTLRTLRNAQRSNLQSGQNQIVINVKRLWVWHSIKTQVNFADIEFNVFNGNIFDLPAPNYWFKESIINIENGSDIATGDLPQIINNGGDRLGASTVGSLTIRQPLSEAIFNILNDARKAKFIRWKFEFILTVNGKGFPYRIDWEDIHDSIKERN